MSPGESESGRPSDRGSVAAPDQPTWRGYEALLDSVGGIVWEVDLETDRFRFVSKQAERLLGYPVRRWIEEPDFWVQHMHPEDRGWAPRFCREAAGRGQSHEFEYRMIAADGRTVWLRDICTVVAEPGRGAVIRGVMVDVTGQREADAALRQANERLRMVVANAPVILFAMDRNGVVTLCEGRGLEVAGIDPTEVLGQPVLEWTRHTPQIARNIQRALDGEEFSDAVVFEQRSFETRYAPIRGEAGRVEGVIGVALDVTDLLRGEDERSKLEAQVRHAQKLESLGVLAGGIAHDFNNLLTTIVGSASLALEDPETASPARDQLARIERAARSAAELTNQLLAYAGQSPPDVHPLNLSDLVAGMLDLLQVSISKKARLDYDLAEELPAVDGDSAQLGQVVLNLVTNASDALRGETGQIHVRTGVCEIDGSVRRETWLPTVLADGPHVFLEVSDTGTGMDAETKARIFDPFFTTKFVGRGLGLATVLGIVRGHQGALSVYSEPGRGTTFRVLLPVSEREASSAPEASRPDSAWQGAGVVLVVDDEASVRDIVDEMLGRLGFEVVLAEDGRQAVSLLAANPRRFRLVLLDATMPEMSGEEALHAVRAVRNDVPVVMMSGYREDYAASRLASTLAGFVQKPFSPAELARVLRAALDE